MLGGKNEIYKIFCVQEGILMYIALTQLQGYNTVYKLLKRKAGHEGLGKDAELLFWDTRHNDLEAYRTPKKHCGSIEPGTWRLYKPPVPGRKLFKGK